MGTEVAHEPLPTRPEEASRDQVRKIFQDTYESFTREILDKIDRHTATEAEKWSLKSIKGAVDKTINKTGSDIDTAEETFTFSRDGRTFTQDEGIPMEDILAYLDRKTNEEKDPGKKKDLKSKKAILDHFSKKYSDLHNDSSDSTTTGILEARKEREAKFISKDYRSTGDMVRDWHKAVDTLNKRRELRLPPIMGTPTQPEPAPQEPVAPEPAPQEPVAPEPAPQEPVAPEPAPQGHALPKEFTLGMASYKKNISQNEENSEEVLEANAQQLARQLSQERRGVWESRFPTLKRGIQRLWKDTIAQSAFYAKDKRQAIRLLAESGLQTNNLPSLFLEKVDTAVANQLNRRGRLSRLTRGVRNLGNAVIGRENDAERERVKMISQLREAVLYDPAVPNAGIQAFITSNQALVDEFGTILNGDFQATEQMARRLSASVGGTLLGLRTGIGETRQQVATLPENSPLRQFYVDRVITPLLQEGLTSATGTISEQTLLKARVAMQDFYHSVDFIRWYDQQPPAVQQSLQLSMSYGSDLIPLVQEVILPELKAAGEHMKSTDAITQYAKNIVLNLNVGTLKANAETNIGETLVERIVSRGITNQRVMDTYQRIRSTGGTPRLVTEDKLRAATNRAGILQDIAAKATPGIWAVGIGAGIYLGQQAAKRGAGTLAPFIGGTAVAAGMRGWQEARLLDRERKIHEIEDAYGNSFPTDAARRREIKENAEISKRNIGELSGWISSIQTKIENGTATGEDMIRLLGLSADKRARVSISDTLGVDLFRSKSPSTYNQERTALDLQEATARAKLREYLTANPAKQAELATEITNTGYYLPPGVTTDVEISNLLNYSNELQNLLTDNLKIGTVIRPLSSIAGLTVEQNMSLEARQESYNRLKARRVIVAAGTTAVGAFLGLGLTHFINYDINDLAEKNPSVASFLRNRGWTKDVAIGSSTRGLPEQQAATTGQMTLHIPGDYQQQVVGDKLIITDNLGGTHAVDLARDANGNITDVVPDGKDSLQPITTHSSLSEFFTDPLKNAHGTIAQTHNGINITVAGNKATFTDANNNQIGMAAIDPQGGLTFQGDPQQLEQLQQTLKTSDFEIGDVMKGTPKITQGDSLRAQLIDILHNKTAATINVPGGKSFQIDGVHNIVTFTDPQSGQTIHGIIGADGQFSFDKSQNPNVDFSHLKQALQAGGSTVSENQQSGGSAVDHLLTQISQNPDQLRQQGIIETDPSKFPWNFHNLRPDITANTVGNSVPGEGNHTYNELTGYIGGKLLHIQTPTEVITREGTAGLKLGELHFGGVVNGNAIPSNYDDLLPIHDLGLDALNAHSGPVHWHDMVAVVGLDNGKQLMLPLDGSGNAQLPGDLYNPATGDPQGVKSIAYALLEKKDGSLFSGQELLKTGQVPDGVTIQSLASEAFATPAGTTPPVDILQVTIPNNPIIKSTPGIDTLHVTPATTTDVSFTQATPITKQVFRGNDFGVIIPFPRRPLEAPEDIKKDKTNQQSHEPKGTPTDQPTATIEQMPIEVQKDNENESNKEKISETFNKIQGNVNSNHKYFVPNLPNSAEIPLTPEQLRALTVAEPYFSIDPNDNGNLLTNTTRFPYISEMEEDPRYKSGEALTDGDSGLLALAGASARTPQEQAKLYEILGRAILRIHSSNPNALREWYKAQTKTQTAGNTFPSIQAFLMFDNRYTDDNLKLVSNNQGLLSEEAFNNLWVARRQELQNALATQELTPAQTRWLEMLSHSVDVVKLINILQSHQPTPVTNNTMENTTVIYDNESFMNFPHAEEVAPQEADRILSSAEIHSSKPVEKQLLSAEGLAPSYKIKIKDTTYWISKPYISSGRVAVVVYIQKGTNNPVARTFYNSNSQGTWRLLPAYRDDGWLDKGYSEESLNVPFAIQRALGFIRAANTPSEPPKNNDIFFGLCDESGIANPNPDSDYKQEVSPTPQRLEGKFYSDSNAKAPPETLIFDTGSQQEPDYSKPLVTWVSPHNLYGTITVEVFPSKDGTLQYMLCTAQDGRLWIADVQKNSDITSTGVREQWIDAGDLTTPAFEYESQSSGYGNNLIRKGDYVDMRANYLSKIPVLLQYIRLTQNPIKNIKQSPHTPTITRRQFLRLGALGAALAAGKIVAGNILTDSPPAPIPAGTTHAIPQQNQNRPEAPREVPTPSIAYNGEFNGQKIKITGYGTTGNFLIETANGQTSQMPIEQVTIISEIGPLKKVYRRGFIGINLDFHNTASVKKAVELGVGAVRIDAAQGLDQDISATQKTIAEAMKYNLKINIIFRPQQLEDEITILTRIRKLFEVIGSYPDVSIELGNEPDDIKVDGRFEKGKLNKNEGSNLPDFTKDIARSIRAIRQQENGKNTKIIIGALVNSSLTGLYLDYLKEEGINLDDYEYAIHPYWTVDEVESKFNIISEELKKRGVNSPRILATEIGNTDKKGLFEMLRKARELGIEEADIYTLVENPEEIGFGFLMPVASPNDKYPPKTDFYRLQQFIQQDSTTARSSDRLITL